MVSLVSIRKICIPASKLAWQCDVSSSAHLVLFSAFKGSTSHLAFLLCGYYKGCDFLNKIQECLYYLSTSVLTYSERSLLPHLLKCEEKGLFLKASCSTLEHIQEVTSIAGFLIQNCVGVTTWVFLCFSPMCCTAVFHLLLCSWERHSVILHWCEMFVQWI